MTATDRAAALELAREYLDDLHPQFENGETAVLARALIAADAERERLERGLKDIAEYDCGYGDNCPVFGSRHGACFGCRARRVLAYATKATTDTERHDG